ncbi:DUF4434 domain-containing protein [Paenibacillus sp. GD4]|jgi:hypothetical protein|uniref:DUF4434 domain-containing protein n=1 Tax=Paenibacillus sp. GD4 TaxID=3068890 RepID=UPI002796D125|nr:DUF4434 domain-containing protein [Paenibacillus sp. GD4]MDQ1913518.1 DUF4434 domain-containing protein [Paenibacillus sp. GD4]
MKRITGSWFDFYHCNPYEGDTWNAATQQFSVNDWDAKIAEMAEAGMDTLILLSVALHGKAFYPSDVMPLRWDMLCPDPLEAVLTAGDRLGLSIYLGLGFFTTPIMGSLSLEGDPSPIAREMAKELASRYGRHTSFAGWYLPVEAAIYGGYFPENYIYYANQMSDFLRALGPSKVLIAPYGTRSVKGDSAFITQLRFLDVDYIAYQDEIGVSRTTFEAVRETFLRLREAHDLADKPLWADIELFRFQGKVLYPGSVERIIRQIEVVSPLVDKTLCYQYHGLMNKPGSKAHAGHESSIELYQGYMDYVRSKGLL